MNTDEQERENTNVAVVEAELTFIPKEQGGRARPLGDSILRSRTYRPHIVLGDISQREPVIQTADGMKQLKEEYLGVIFLDGPERVVFGESIKVKMGLLYYPRLFYAAVVPGRTFTLREGGHIVGYGTITNRHMERLAAAEDGS